MEHHQHQHHLHLPKFKSLPPPSLPLSPPPISPSSYLALSELLDSPVLFNNSNLVASPTTGAFASEGFNWSNFLDGRGGGGGSDKCSDFSFQLPRTLPEPTQEEPWKRQEQLEADKFFNNSFQKTSTTGVKSEFAPIQSFNTSESQTYSTQPSDGGVREQKKSNDGYNWRKYGQKQVKGSENPRSYYKCTYPSCPTKKKVETSLDDGHVTEIVYKGSHNHPKPQSTRRSNSQSVTVQANNNNNNNAHASPEVSSDQSASLRMESETLQEDSSVSTGGEDIEGISHHSRGDDTNETEPDAKRWKGDGEYNRGSSSSENKTVREPRVVVQTLSEIDILDDGYKWRKYGQKVVKGNPNPRSYYKCTYIGCLVRKHVERAAQDTRAVITTYEGKHNHDVPVGRGGQTMDRSMAQGAAPMPIRPTAIATHPIAGGFRPEMGSFGFPGFGENMNMDSVLSRAKEEPKENSLFGSFLS